MEKIMKNVKARSWDSKLLYFFFFMQHRCINGHFVLVRIFFRLFVYNNA